MVLLTIASTKGGVGKSTFTINLATELMRLGHKVAVLDADPQNTISKWNKVREYMISQGENLQPLFVASAQGESLIEIALMKREQGYITLIDSPGVNDSSMRAALLRSDYVITPAPPSPVDLWEVETLIQVVKKLSDIQRRRIPIMLLFNKVPTGHNIKNVEESIKYIEEGNVLIDYIIKTEIKTRQAYQHSIKEGRGVVEYSPSDIKACDEIKRCAIEIISKIKEKNKLKEVV